MIPQQRPGQSFDSHQAEVAAWLGCSVDQMNAQHDPLHVSLCRWLGVTSQAMRHAAGEKLTNLEHGIALLEEEACLHLQRLIVMLGEGVPD